MKNKRYSKLRTAIFIPLLICICISSCKRESDPVSNQEPTPKLLITGRWQGSSQGLSIDLQISHLHGYDLTGVGTLLYDDKNVTVTASGILIDSSLTLNVANGNFQSIQYSARMIDSAKFYGRINGSGFTNLPFYFSKQ